MAKYLVQASYTSDGTKGVLKEGGTGRRKAIQEMLKPLEGKLESMYYAFGDTDVFVVVELPDNITAAAASLAINQAGAVSARTTLLLSPEEIDAAVRKTVAYRAPGK